MEPSSATATSKGFVKSLLYPGFTDSGSNEAFRYNVPDEESSENDESSVNSTHSEQQREHNSNRETALDPNDEYNDTTNSRESTFMTDNKRESLKSTYDDNLNQLHASPPKTSCQNSQLNNNTKSVISLQYSENGTSIDGRETGTDIDASNFSTANMSVNTSGGAVSSVLGYNFLPTAEGNEYDSDENNNNTIAMSSGAAISGTRTKYKQKNTDNIDSSSKVFDDNADSENFEESSRRDNNDNTDENVITREVHTSKDNFRSNLKTAIDSTSHPPIEECNSNESIMGSENRSEQSSHFEGTVIGNLNKAKSIFMYGKSNRQNNDASKLDGNLGITAELLRAMEEEHEGKDGNNVTIEETLRNNNKVLDDTERSRTPPPLQQQFDIKDYAEPSTVTTARRKKMDIFPLTTPPSNQLSKSTEPNTDFISDTNDQMPSPLVLPSLDPTDSSTANKLNSNTSKTPVYPQSPSLMDKKQAPSPKNQNSKRLTSNHQILLSPLRQARKCLSVDNDDTLSSVVEGYHFSEDLNANDKKTMRLWKPMPSQSSRSLKRNIKHSKSWDVGGRYETQNFPSNQSLKYSMKGQGETKQQIQRGRKKIVQNTTNTRSRFLKSHEFSPAVMNDQNTTLLQSSQRVELERDDALDLLACLVKRSLAFHHENLNPEKNSSSKRDGNSPPQPPSPRQSSSTSSVSPRINQINVIVKDLESISKYYEEISSNESKNNIATNHIKRSVALKSLMRSHTYALEMKSTALGASKWLDAIRTSSNSATKGGAGTGFSLDSPIASIVDPENKKLNSNIDINNISRVQMNERIQELEKKFIEKNEYSQRLNEELSKCRAEIGRLRSAARAEVLFTSPNRSILDFDDEDESSASSASTAAKDEIKVLENVFQEVADVPKTSPKQSDIDSLRETTAEKRAIVLLKAEVQKLKTQIQSMQQEKTTYENEQKDEGFEDKSDSEQDATDVKNHERGQEEIGTVSSLKLSLDVSIHDKILAIELDEYQEAFRKEDKAQIESLKRELELALSHSETLNHTLSEEKHYLQKEANSLDMSASPSSSSMINSSKSHLHDMSNDEKVINVKMLDGENFVTEWNPLAQSLPPPPDHELRSPIVDALLLQWTPDVSMHNSLLAWMDRAMNGDNPANIPPLQIASLDHQVRDGFAMHVLPLLLRRSDVDVKVTTRAHRTTTYDIAVIIERSQNVERYHSQAFSNNNISAIGNLADTKHMMAFKASSRGNTFVDTGKERNEDRTKNSINFRKGMTDFWRSHNSETGSRSITSTTVTSPVSNRESYNYEGNTQYVRDSMDDPSNQYVLSSGMSVGSTDESVGSSITGASGLRSVQNSSGPGIMSAIGGAFGGFLGRGKKTSVPKVNYQRSQSSDESDIDQWNKNKFHQSFSKSYTQNIPNSGQRHSVPLNQPHSSIPPHPGDEDHPYHRVVSAPSGRIGVTFVQFRGHAMVSDIAPDSPLCGWVFPSDILIAIDEVPVSGMRVRDIVKLLTARVDRQRALRMISTHAMEELTQPSIVD